MTPDFEPTRQENQTAIAGNAPAASWIAQALGRLDRWTRARRDPDVLVDAHTGVLNWMGLESRGDEMLRECSASRGVLSVAVFKCPDLLELRSIYGNRIALKLLQHIVRKLRAVAGRRGLVARTGPAEFTLVMPGLRRDKARIAFDRVLGRTARIEFDTGDDEIVLVPAFAIESSGPDVESVLELYKELRTALEEDEQQELRRQHYLQRERERHSRPMGISAIAEVPAPRRASPRIQVSPTMPAPFAIQ